MVGRPEAGKAKGQAQVSPVRRLVGRVQAGKAKGQAHASPVQALVRGSEEAWRVTGGVLLLLTAVVLVFKPPSSRSSILCLDLVDADPLLKNFGWHSIWWQLSELQSRQALGPFQMCPVPQDLQSLR